MRLGTLTGNCSKGAGGSSAAAAGSAGRTLLAVQLLVGNRRKYYYFSMMLGCGHVVKGAAAAAPAGGGTAGWPSAAAAAADATLKLRLMKLMGEWPEPQAWHLYVELGRNRLATMLLTATMTSTRWPRQERCRRGGWGGGYRRLCRRRRASALRATHGRDVECPVTLWHHLGSCQHQRRGVQHRAARHASCYVRGPAARYPVGR